jgi:ComEC/Rec2-related protein
MKYKYWPVFVFVPLALTGMLRARASLTDPMAGTAYYVDGLSGVISEQGLTANGNLKLTVDVEYGDVKYGDVQYGDVRHGDVKYGDVKRVMVYLTEWTEVNIAVKREVLLGRSAADGSDTSVGGSLTNGLDTLTVDGKAINEQGIFIDNVKSINKQGKLVANDKSINEQGMFVANEKSTRELDSLIADGTYIGLKVTFSGMLEPLEHPTAPGDFDEFRYLRSRKTDAKVFPDKIEITEGGDINLYLRLLIFLRQTRDRLVNVYDAALPPREAGIMKSVLLGDKSGLDEDTAELYRASGTYHLLCISGLHIGIFLLGLGGMFKLFINERYAWLAGLFILILYALLTGASVSTVRATVMGAVFVFSKLIFRDYDLPSSTSFACIALLIYEPLYLYDAGFQLSFGAVFGIAFLTAPVERGLSRIMRGFPYKNALASGIAATLATYPILMYHFQEISTYGVIVNLFIIPTASLLVVSGLIVGIAGLFFIPAAMFLAGVSYYMLMFYDIICNFFNGLPYAQIQTGPPNLMICALVYAAIACFAMALSKFNNKLKT